MPIPWRKIRAEQYCLHREIVPLLSCVLARRSILSIGGFSLAGGPDNQEIVASTQKIYQK